MNSTQLKKEIKKRIDTADADRLKIIYEILKEEENYESWEKLPAKLKKSIDRGLKEAKQGKLIPHEDVVKKYPKYFSQ